MLAWDDHTLPARLLLLLRRRTGDRDILNHTQDGARVQEGERRAHHLCGLRAQGVAGRLMLAEVISHARLDAGVAIELAHEWREVEHVEDAGEKIVRALGGLKLRRRREREGERDVTRGLLS